MPAAKHLSRIRRIVPFGIIWLVFGIAYGLLERGVLDDSPVYLSSGSPYDFRTSLIINSLATLAMGLLLGTLEVYLLHRLFRKRRFWTKIAAKTVLYVTAIIVFLLGLNSIYYSRLLGVPITDPQVARINLMSFGSFSFWSIVVYIGVVATVSLLFAEVSLHIGHGVIRNFFTGKYHTPKEEERIFMFLDMKSSTTLAEQMGHVKYFELLNRYYADMTEAITASSGEICQYVGDEVVITWTLEKGLRENDCLECFFRIKDRLSAQSERYMKDFGRVPGFKAGLHCGHVTTGQIGTVRKDIVFSGDVMNTAARIQSLCNESGVDLLISEVLMTQLKLGRGYGVHQIGVRELRGKDERVRLFTVAKESV